MAKRDEKCLNISQNMNVPSLMLAPLPFLGLSYLNEVKCTMYDVTPTKKNESTSSLLN